MPLDMDPDLQELVDEQLRLAKKQFEKRGDLAPMMILLSKATKSVNVIGLSFADELEKDACALVLRWKAKEIDADAALFLAESWVVTQEGDKADAQRIQPSQHPDRREVVQAVLEIPGQMWMAACPIVRIKGMKPALCLEPFKQDWTSAEGRFVNVLEQNRHKDTELRSIVGRMERRFGPKWPDVISKAAKVMEL